MAASTVMQAWAERKPVEVTEQETLALLENAIAPRFVQFTWGACPVRMLPQGQCEWAYRELAVLRGEVTP